LVSKGDEVTSIGKRNSHIQHKFLPWNVNTFEFVSQVLLLLGFGSKELVVLQNSLHTLLVELPQPKPVYLDVGDHSSSWVVPKQ
jgi:hypothetical protein